jgi:hypothetical protein
MYRIIACASAARRLVLAAFLLLGTLLMSQPAISAPGDQNPGIAPIFSHPHGKSYPEWAATWERWALGTPASVNPLLDRGTCDVGQVGRVWFLAGTNSNATGTTVRTCTIVTGTALFVPLINIWNGAVLTDPPVNHTEAFIRAQTSCSQAVITAAIDGVAVNNPTQYFERSPLFDVQLPTDNIFGVDETVAPQLLVSPSADSGYYLFVNPLEPGNHTIRWTASWTCPFFGDFGQDMRYTVTVVPGTRKGALK